jgi:site-specific DNA recombinase
MYWVPGPARPKNLYVREDQILPRLAALAILHADDSHSPQGGEKASAQVTAPAQAADLIDRLQAADVKLIYDPATRALRTGTSISPAVTVG